MDNCILRNEAFNKKAEKYDIHPDVLENVLYDLENSLKREPTQEEIEAYLRRGKSNEWTTQEAADKAASFMQQQNFPLFATAETVDSVVETLSQYFPTNSIVVIKRYNGEYRIDVVPPTVKEVSFSLETEFVSSLFRGQQNFPVIDKNGNLVLKATYDNLWGGWGLSFATNRTEAENYGRRSSRNPVIIEIDKSYLDEIIPLDENAGTQGDMIRSIGDEYGAEEREERLLFTKDIIIPKGKFKIHHKDSVFPSDTYELAKNYIRDFDISNTMDEMPFSSTYNKVADREVEEERAELLNRFDGDKNKLEAFLTEIVSHFSYSTYTPELKNPEVLKYLEFTQAPDGSEVARYTGTLKKTVDVKSATENSGTFYENDPGIYNQESSDIGNVTDLPDKMTAGEAFQILSKQYAPDSPEAKLSKLVFDALQQTGITFEASDELPPDVRGRFSASDNTIFFNKNGILSNTLLHESIHAVSIYYMKAANKNGFSKEVQIACKEIEECYELLKQDMLDRKVPINSIYGMTSATELIAEITRPEVISLIKDYDSRHKGENIFQRLVDAIAKFFGINKSYGSLEKTLKDALVTLIENPNAQLMKRYALENRTAKENWETLRTNGVEWSRSDKYRGIIEEAAERAPEDGRVEITISKQDILNGVAFMIPEKVSGGIISESPIGTLFVSTQRRGAFDVSEEVPIFFTIDGSARVDSDNVTLPIQLISLEWMSTNQFSIQTAKNGMPYITDIMPLFNSVTQQATQQGTQYVNHSGGAIGSDSYWGAVGERYGVKSNHYYHGNRTPNGNVAITEEQFEEGKQKVLQANQTLNRQPSRYMDLLARNWMQVKNSDSVFAIGHLENGIVNGGTGWAVQMAIDAGKPVYVFDQEKNQWYKNINGKWSETDTPTLTPNFAGIGTRQLTDAGKQAIEDVYTKTFKVTPSYYEGKITQQSNVQSTPNVVKSQTEVSNSQAVREELQPFAEQSRRSYEQHKALLDGVDEKGRTLITATELTHIAQQTAYGMVDLLTLFQENPSNLFKVWPEKHTTNEDGSFTDIEADYAKVKGMTHLELVNFIGVDNFVNAFKDSTYNTTIQNFDLDITADKADLIYDNFEAVVEEASSTFALLENFSLVKTSQGLEVKENYNINADEINGETGEQIDTEAQGDQRDHWQIESRTMDVFMNMSALIRQQLAKTYLLQEVEVVDENGNSKKQYIPVLDEFGIKERVNPRDAINSILYWVEGSRTLGEMVEKLKLESVKNPWLKSIIGKLEVQEGVENPNSDFQNQFFNVASKISQIYSIIDIATDGRMVLKSINVNPALKKAFQSVQAAVRVGESPLFKITGGVQQETLATLNTISEKLQGYRSINDITKLNIDDVANLLNIAYNSFGLNTSPEFVKEALYSIENFHKMVDYLEYILKSVNKEKDNENYEPFLFDRKNNPNNIYSNMQEFLKPLTDQLEATTESSVYDDGKMYQAHVLPSYMTKMVGKLRASDAEFRNYVMEEYGQSEWFRDTSDTEYKVSSWKTPWLRLLWSMSEEERKKLFEHKVLLNFNKHSYMRKMSPAEQTLSHLTAYFNETQNVGSIQTANYATPIMSNAPSMEFIKFVKYAGVDYDKVIVEGFKQIFNQELSRIQTVKERRIKFADSEGKFDASNPEFIERFDENGDRFHLVSWFNDDVNGHTELGRLIEKKVSGEKLSDEQLIKLDALAEERIYDSMDTLVKQQLTTWKNDGILKEAAKIENINHDFATVEDALENYIWNYTFAQMNILELTIIDPAFYKNSDDIQKRYKQLHASGEHGNPDAVDYDGKKVSDGKFRTLTIADFNHLKSNIIDNLKEVFAKEAKRYSGEQLKAYNAFVESVLEAYNNVDLTDGQAFTSLSGYRKKAITFGKWGRNQEELYKKLKRGEVNYTDYKTLFQPLKPFVYTQESTPTNVTTAPIKTLKYGKQIKDSEYLIVMADALLRNKETSRPNLLKVFFDIMEESASNTDGVAGIDTIQFASTVKTGNRGIISLKGLTTEDEAYGKLHLSIYNENGSYNPQYVESIKIENYMLQTNVPEHFIDHWQKQASQGRYIIQSDLVETDVNGNPAIYKVKFSDGETKEYSAKEFKREFENLNAENIKENIQSLLTELGYYVTKEGTIGIQYSQADVNLAISKILRSEIISSPRYDADLLVACTVVDGKFALPLNDPIQAKRVEQLLNSVIKSRVNKQEIAGGMLVQVSNFGTQKLNIRYNDKNGNLLMTKEEFAKTAPKDGKSYDIDKAYEKYTQDNQAGIAYYEAFASIYNIDIFKQFADRNGVIDIKAIEAVDPELLKLVGLRVPTEDKYSMIPIKIVGFLPKEAGNAIMLPEEITTITGADFDIDKLFIMRKELSLSKNKSSLRDTVNYIQEKLKDISIEYPSDIKTDAQKKRFIATTIRELIQDGIMGDFDNDPFRQAVKREYLAYKYTIKQPDKNTRAWRNNRIIDMYNTVLTSEYIAPQVLNPGNFDPERRLGYTVAAIKAGKGTWESLQHLSIDELSKLAASSDNIAFPATRDKLYKRNYAAGNTLAMAAVARAAHAVLSGDGFTLNVDYALNQDDAIFTIGSTEFAGSREIDPMRDKNGEFVGRTIGRLVGASADVGKESVLDLMNITPVTMNVLTGMERLGMPFEEIALLLSGQAITEVLNALDLAKLSENTSLLKEVNKMLNAIAKDQGFTLESQIMTEPLEIEEMRQGLRLYDLDKNDREKIRFKTLLALKNCLSLTTSLQSITDATRLNSEATAVGPLAIDNLIIQDKLETSANFDAINEIDNLSDILDRHPILAQFKRAYDIAGIVLRDMPGNNAGFRNLVLWNMPSEFEQTILRDRAVLSKLSDFYQSFQLIAAGLTNPSGIEGNTQTGIKYFIEQFPADFVRGKAKERYADNPFIQAINLHSERIGKDTYRTVLDVDTNGMDNGKVSRLKSGWADLHKQNPKLSTLLFWYNFYRGGIGFSPKTFMNLVPTQVKQQIEGYVNTLENPVPVPSNLIFDQFIRNNASNTSLVPIKKAKINAVGTNMYRVTFKGNATPLYFTTQEINPMAKEGQTIYRQIDLTENPLNIGATLYEKVSVLGNAGEYFEASTDRNYTPAQIPPVETTKVADIADIEWKSDELSQLSDNFESRLTINAVVNNILVEKYNKLPADRLEDMERPYKNILIKGLQDRGIKISEEATKELWETFCVNKKQ